MFKQEKQNNSSASKPAILLLQGAGAAILLGAFIHWIITTGYSTPAVCFAAFSVFTALGIYLKFVPMWINFRNKENKSTVITPTGMEYVPPYTYLKIFSGLISLSIVVLLLVFLFRYKAGYSSTLRQGLEIWIDTDARHYLDIAREGYLSQGEWDRLVQLVFLPGYPLAVRIVNIFVKDWLISAFAVSIICFGMCGCVFYKLLRLDYSHKQAVKAVKYLAIFPSRYFFRGPLSESLFLLCFLSSVYLVRTKKYLPACFTGFYAAFTRPMGVTLPVIIIMEYLREDNRNISKKEILSKISVLLSTAAGFCSYLVINYVVSDDFFKFMHYQKVHWYQGFGWFFSTAAYQSEYLMGSLKDSLTVAMGLWIPNFAAVMLSLIIVFFTVKKLRPSYSAWFIAYYFTSVGVTWLISRPRYMAVMFCLPLGLMHLSKNKKADIAITLCCAAGYLYYLYAFSMRWAVW